MRQTRSMTRDFPKTILRVFPKIQTRSVKARITSTRPKIIPRKPVIPARKIQIRPRKKTDVPLKKVVPLKKDLHISPPQKELSTIIDQLSLLENVERQTGLQMIIDKFQQNIQGKSILAIQKQYLRGNKGNQNDKNAFHGQEGYVIENALGATHNANNCADLYGYEIKKFANTITFGDWKADEYIFQPGNIIQTHNHYISGNITQSKSRNRKVQFSLKSLHHVKNGRIQKVNRKVNKQVKPLNNIPSMNKHTFLRLFGTQNPNKYDKDGQNRFSWSGQSIPQIQKYNTNGQILIVDHHNNIYILYNNKYDKELNKKPPWVKALTQLIILAYWSKNKIEQFVHKKFNMNGFIICKKNSQDIYDTLLIGKPFDLDYWIQQLKSGIVYFDSGMYSGNNRFYSLWRAKTEFWKQLIVDEVK